MRIYDNLEKLAKSDPVRFFMPGHKGGKNLPESYISPIMPYDMTELRKTDDLFAPEGVIKASQEKLAQMFSTTAAHYLAGGATLGLYGAISVCVKPGSKVLLDRGCHRSVLDAMILMGAEPVFLDSERNEFGVLSPVNAMDVYNALEGHPDFAAVVITSPTYYGLCSLIEPIHAVTSALGIPLIVDAAHGGNMLCMGLLPLCAEFTVVSLHKTLPSLTGAAVLFSNGFDADMITKNLALFSTTSPSHVILASAEKSITYMMNEGQEQLSLLMEKCAYFTAWLDMYTPFSHIEDAHSDITRIVIHTGETTMSGTELYNILEDNFNIICEMSDDENVVLIPSIGNTDSDFERLMNALLEISKNVSKKMRDIVSSDVPEIEMQMKMRDAFFSDKEYIPIKDAVGRIACESIMRYPPGIPYIIPGQLIGKYEFEQMTHLGVEKILVVK